MKIISWNVQGLVNIRTFLTLKDILREHKPQILFVCETKMKLVQMKNMGKTLGFENCLKVGRIGMGDGLALLWNDEIDVNMVSYSNHQIDAVIYGVKGNTWRCTGIYDHLESRQKWHTWMLLRRLASLFNYPWLCFGDFNEILNLNEKVGGNDQNLNMMADFREVVNDYNLVDLGCKGYPFTWSNKRYRPYLIEESLDRFLGSKDWEQSSYKLTVTNLNSWCSDHNLIMLGKQEKTRFNWHQKKSCQRLHMKNAKE
ncbi:hypothetical protein AB3S75_027034 [Citrus x aurantiifolia]